MLLLSVDESGKSIVKSEEKSGKIMSKWCCFPPQVANSGIVNAHTVSVGIHCGVRAVSQTSAFILETRNIDLRLTSELENFQCKTNESP